MTDKQIIIDGVDVSGCGFYSENEGNTKNACYQCRLININTEKFIGYGCCDDNKNCYFKQLKRKEHECEELEKTLTEIKEIAEICKYHNVDGCYECKYFDDCEVEDEEIPTRDVCKLILQKISEVVR